MGVIIGAATTVAFGAAGGHATQISWNVNTNVQRAYVLGDWAPYTDAEVTSPTETLNVTVYSPGPTYATTPSNSCDNANQLAASVSPAGCGAGSDGPTSTTWYVTGYNYSKGDARQPGQEAWSLMQYVTLGITGVIIPTYNLRGISEGSITSSDVVATAATKAGIDIDIDTVSTGTTGSVSAGQIGRSDYQYTGVITQVGASSGGSGDIVNGSCSMPYTALYI